MIEGEQRGHACSPACRSQRPGSCPGGQDDQKLPFEDLDLSFRAIAGRVIRRLAPGEGEHTRGSGRRPRGGGNDLEPGHRRRNMHRCGAGEPGQTVGLSFTVRVRDADPPVALKAEIRSAHVAAGEGKNAVALRPEFEDVPACSERGAERP